MHTKDETVFLINKLLETKKIAEIAVEVGRCTQTIERWKRGTSLPSKGDWELLKGIKNE